MAEKRRFLDVWIVESNTVYREVPFTVVADWVQQGRLLADDKLRPSGTAEWYPIGGSPDFAPYLPRYEPYQAEDQAEALEPVQLDFSWKRGHEEEDDDVDMIPLIDVSLVLLIFFMLTASTVSMAAFIPTPTAENGRLSNDPEEIQLGINLEGEGEARHPVFSLSMGSKPPAPEDSNLGSVGELLTRLSAHLEENPSSEKVEVSINAHPKVKSSVVLELLTALDHDPYRRRVQHKMFGVSERAR